MDVWRVIGWLGFVLLLYAALQAYLGRREFVVRRARFLEEQTRDPVIAAAFRRMGRSYWLTVGAELALAGVVLWLVLR